MVILVHLYLLEQCLDPTFWSLIKTCNFVPFKEFLIHVGVHHTVNHGCRHFCRVAVSHRCHCCPCRWPLLSPSPLAIAVAIAVGHHHRHAIGHFQELLPWRSKNCIRPIEAKNAYLILLCSDSGGRIDQSRMTDQVSSGDGQHQQWAPSGKQ